MDNLQFALLTVGYALVGFGGIIFAFLKPKLWKITGLIMAGVGIAMILIGASFTHGTITTIILVAVLFALVVLFMYRRGWLPKIR